MKPSRAAYALIIHFEGFRAKAYKCPSGVLTIGYGHTGNYGNTEEIKAIGYDHTNEIKAISHNLTGTVKATDVITKSKALDLLTQDVNKLCVPCLKDLKLNQYQYDALCSFIYNVGPTNFNKSTMKKLLTEGKYDEAAEQFDRWTKAKGKTLKGLVERRSIEKRLFLGYYSYEVE